MGQHYKDQYERDHGTAVMELAMREGSTKGYYIHAQLHIAIRKEPALPGIRTGLQISEGKKAECIESKEIQYVHTDGRTYPVTFHRLKNGTGWIHDFNPKNPGEASILLVDTQNADSPT